MKKEITFSHEEKRQLQSAHDIMYGMRCMIDRFCQIYSPLKDLYMCGKGCTKDGQWVSNPDYKEYGYYINENIERLYMFMKEHKKDSLLDLGAGIGVLLQGLKIMDIKVHGYENEELLVNLANRPNGFNKIVTKKNILHLTKEDIQGYEVIYWWEPIRNHQLNKKFIDNLVSILDKNQLIYAIDAGASNFNLNANPHIKRISSDNYYGYKLK